MQDYSNSIANALELLQSCTEPSKWCSEEAIIHVKSIITLEMKMNEFYNFKFLGEYTHKQVNNIMSLGAFY